MASFYKRHTVSPDGINPNDFRIQHDEIKCACRKPVIPEIIEKELQRRIGDIPETCKKAAEASIYCGLTCALEALIVSIDKGVLP
jgi:hypothetical protein